MISTETTTVNDSVPVQEVATSAYRIPTATPEADGTLQWDQTTIVLVEIHAGGHVGIGYTYGDASIAQVIDRSLKEWVKDKNAFDIPGIVSLLVQQIRNNGSCGIAMMAVSAIDCALWDLKARLLDQPLCNILGKVREEMPLYGSGGFTNYSDKELKEQFIGWEELGIGCMKMKIGSRPEKDVERVRVARNALDKRTKIFVDANGAYTVKQALAKAEEFADLGVTWFEEPVSSDKLEGLRFIRDHAPAQMDIAAGEYGYNLTYFKEMLKAGAVDVLQADATRCGGISGFLKASTLAESFGLPVSSHCAPAVHLHAAMSLPNFYLAEYFFDHGRIESMLFDGASVPRDGCLFPELSRPGLGIDFKKSDAKKYKI